MIIVNFIKALKYTIKKLLYKIYQSPLYFSKNKNRIIDGANYLKNKSNRQKSILLWTTHKTASTFIGKVLKEFANNSNYKYFDYASSIWYMGDSFELENPFIIESNCPFLFKDFGEIYGPLRTPFKISQQNNYTNIFIVRDPRDLLISNFYSKSFSHELPNTKFIKKEFINKRTKFIEKGIDQYCLEYVDKWIIPYFKNYQEMKDNCNGSEFLTYEYFLNSPSNFINKLSQYMNIKIGKNTINKLTKKATSPFYRDLFINNNLSHFRSGKSRQFENEIRKETLNELNEKLKDILIYWGFNI